MLLRSGKLTSVKKISLKKKCKIAHVDLPFDIQRRIFSKIDLYLLRTEDRTLQKHIVVNGLYNDPEALLCWAIGRRDRWLVKMLMDSGVKSGDYSQDAAVTNDFQLENVTTAETKLSRQTLMTRHWRRGEFEQALQHYRDETFRDLENDIDAGLQDAVKTNDAGLYRVLTIWPTVLHAVTSYSCMYGKTEILQWLFGQGLLNQWTHYEYFVAFAIDKAHLETARYLLEIGFTLSCYDHKGMHSIFEHESPETLKFVMSKVRIPDTYLQQGMVAAAGSGKLSILQYLVNAGVDCRNQQAMYRAATEGHVETYTYLSQLFHGSLEHASA